MSYKITLTSTLTQNLVLCYRMPKDETGRANPVLEIPLPPRALNIEVAFPNENYYHEFKMQNEGLFLDGRLIEGKATEAQAIDTHEKNNKKTANKAKAKVEKTLETLQEVSQDKLKFSVEKGK